MNTITTSDYRMLAVALMDASESGLDGLLLASIRDAILESGGQYSGLTYDALLMLIKHSGLKMGRKRLDSWLQAEVKAAAQQVYVRRRDRVVNPDGTFDSAGRWYPSSAENCGDMRSIRAPSRAWPYSYMLACRTKKHCVLLIECAVLGYAVPPDVDVSAIRSTLRAALIG
jgi:hypothetical protein